jgi:uncharacterized protein (TIGR02246 family)
MEKLLERGTFMSFLRQGLVCALICASSCVGAVGQSPDERAIKDVFAAFSASWNQPGMPGFGDLFTEDADFVVITGKWMKGRREIVSYHTDLLGKNYTGSHSFMGSVTVRFLQPNVAIAHVASGATYMADGKEQKRTGLGTATMEKVNGKWLIAAFHNTLTSGPGYSWGPSPISQQEKAPAASSHHLVDCPDSPTPGKRPPSAPCAIIAHKTFSALPKAPIVLLLENFPTIEAAQNAVTPASTVVEAVGKVWLLTLGSRGERSKAGAFVTEIGPISNISTAASYELQVADADFGPAMNPAISRAVHTHSGPEIWYLLTGEQCLETPNGIQRAKAGEGMVASANTPMQLNITGTGNREALFAIVHDAAKPATAVSDWQPKGDCQK